MFSFLKPRVSKEKIPQEKVMSTYKKLRILSFIGVFLG